MARKTLLLISLILGLVLTSAVDAADPSLIGYWTFDEGSGSIADDYSGNGNGGTIEGGPQWVTGKIGGGMQFNGDGDQIQLASVFTTLGSSSNTVAAWIKVPLPGTEGLGASERVGNLLGNYNDSPNSNWELHAAGQMRMWWNGGEIDARGTTDLRDNTWHHVAWVRDKAADASTMYIDGQLEATIATVGTDITFNTTHRIAADNRGASTPNWHGLLDDLQVYDRALSQGEIEEIMEGLFRPIASDPSPVDDTVDVLRDVVLNWKPGVFANTHDVYFGTALDDVNEASRDNPLSSLVSQGQSDNTYVPGILAFGQTYYWRVDEVNAAPDNTVFKGEVWRFTAEPSSIPVEMITATASSSNAANMGPENTINGVGLNELDQHSTLATDMWLSGMGDPAPTLQYAFDKTYKLDQLWVWNSNQMIESFIGLGAKDVVIETSLDGAEWTVLEGATLFNQATGLETYAANTVIDFAGILAQYARITISAGHGMLPQYGLSEVRFLYIPTFAREPEPSNGSTVDSANVVLSWRAGREAASHEVMLGTDPADLALVATTSDISYAANGLEYATTYYWSVTEVNDNEAVTSYAGDVSSFTTPDFGTVDDFDQYDDNCNRIFFSWEDGLGHSGSEDIDGCAVPVSNGNGGGSIVGNDQAPFAEKTIVNAGSIQSLPFNYDNSFGPSETRLMLGAQDWTASSIQALSLAFYGTTGNTGTLYVKINDTKIANDDAASRLALEGWQIWDIDLSALSGLQNVSSLTIGVDGASAAGMLYIDDIRLYP
jgi:hypothetical protein